MTIDEILTALRCISTPGEKEGHCEKCPFNRREKVEAELAKVLGTEEWNFCDSDAVSEEAADLIDAQAKEIDALRNELCLKCGNYTLAHEGACNGCRWRR